MPYPETPATVEDLANNSTLQVEICRAFNAKPKEGLKRINEICKDLEDSERQKQIASFFLNNKDNLDLEAVGDYLGTDLPDNKAVLKSFAEQQAPQMEGKDFDQALRGYLQTFRMPGEGQKISRLVTAFGQPFVDANPGCGIENGPSAGKLANAAMMLNASLHNPQVREQDRFTAETFSMGMEKENNGKDFSPQLMSNFFNGIKNNEIKTDYKKVEQSYELNPTKKRDQTFSAVDKELGKKSFDAEQTLGVEGATATVNGRKPFLSGLRGYKSTVTISDKDGNQVTMEVTKPGFFSKKEPTVTIKPVADTPESRRLAAQVTNKFLTPSTAKGTFAYQRDDLKQSLEDQKNGIPLGVKKGVEVPKEENMVAQSQKQEFKTKLEETLNIERPKLSREGIRDLEKVGFKRSEDLDEGEKVQPNIDMKDVIMELKQGAKKNIGDTSGLKKVSANSNSDSVGSPGLGRNNK